MDFEHRLDRSDPDLLWVRLVQGKAFPEVGAFAMAVRNVKVLLGKDAGVTGDTGLDVQVALGHPGLVATREDACPFFGQQTAPGRFRHACPPSISSPDAAPAAGIGF
jgi:hypothetical protein